MYLDLPVFIGQKVSLRTIAGMRYGRRFRAASRFHLRGIGVGHFTTLARHFGGAMTEVEVQDGGSKVGEVASETGAGKRADPEIDQAGAARLVQKAAQKYLLDNLDAIMKCVVEGAKAGRESCIKLLFDWAFKVPADGNLAELPPSFAAELWQMSREVLAEAGM